MLIPTGTAFADGELPPDHIASLSFYIILGMALYAYLALSVQIIARKTETPNDYFAWIPIANLFLLLAIAKKPLWWFFLLLIPFGNVAVGIIVWMRIAENLGKPSWWGFLTLIPLVGFIVPGYLAWSE
jgi:ABC-type Na+ efflux pump permease subunit